MKFKLNYTNKIKQPIKNPPTTNSSVVFIFEASAISLPKFIITILYVKSIHIVDENIILLKLEGCFNKIFTYKINAFSNLSEIKC